MPRSSPVSVYLFPDEASKHGPAVLQVEIEGLVATATEAQADMMSEEGSEGSTDNDDFCILEAPGMGIPVRLSLLLSTLLPFSFLSLLIRSDFLTCSQNVYVCVCCSPGMGSP